MGANVWSDLMEDNEAARSHYPDRRASLATSTVESAAGRAIPIDLIGIAA